MIEADLIEYLETEIPEVDWYWGKQDPGVNVSVQPTGVIFKVPSLISNTTPSYLDNLQITVRSNKNSTAQNYINQVIKLFNLFVGKIGSYNVHVPSIVINGTMYETKDIVSSIITISFKYSGDL